MSIHQNRIKNLIDNAEDNQDQDLIELFLLAFKKRLLANKICKDETRAETIILNEIKDETYNSTLINARNWAAEGPWPIDPTQIAKTVEETYIRGIKKQTKKDKQDEEETEYTSLINNDTHIVEQVYNTEGIQYAIYTKENGEITYNTEYKDKNGIIYKPISTEEVIKEAIGLPERAEEYNIKELDKQIEKHIKKWLDIPEDYLRFAIWNIKRSWVFQKFHTINYLRARGDFGTGKTRYLDVLGSLHYKPLFTSGATTPAPVFRMIEKWRGTLIMDEADFSKSDESQDMIKLINLGLERGKFIMRCDQNDAKNIQLFDAYCPKVLATRRGFQDRATESRCMTYIMTGTTRKDIPVNLNDTFQKEVNTIRNKLLMWRFKNYDKINPDIGEKIDFGDIEPRVRQIATSYASLFSGNDEELENFKTFIQKHQANVVAERQDTFEGTILSTIKELLENGINNITVKDIIEKAGFTNRSGNPMNPRSLTSPLKSLGIVVGKPCKSDGVTKKFLDIDRVLFDDLLKKYGYPVTEVTLVTDSSLKNNFGVNEPFQKFQSFGYHGNHGNLVTENEHQKVPDETEVRRFISDGDCDVEGHVLVEKFGEEAFQSAVTNGEIFESKPGRYKRL